MRARRTFLYVPGSDAHKIAKAAGLGADCVVLDLEDAVTDEKKTEARQVVANALVEFDFSVSEKAVRVNGFPSGRTEGDLAAILPSQPEAIVLPKVNSVADVQKMDLLLSVAENNYKLTGIKLIVIVESALGMVNVEEICRLSKSMPRLQAIVFGAEDFVADMGASRTPQALELLYARSRLVMAANAFGLQAIDLVTVNYQDQTALEREALTGAQMGYSGKQIIHPAQIEPVRRIFSPSEEALQWATRVLDAAKENAARGIGAFTLDGQMVDEPVIKRAEGILARSSHFPN